MVEPVGRYAKDSSRETFLERLNSQLAAGNEAEYHDLDDVFPTLQIIGVPRSGTTLLSQLVSAHLDIGYINHLIAAFWQAPLYGIRLSQQLLEGVRPVDYRSEFGRTESIHDPHEFGYFWLEVLGHRELAESEAASAEIDWDRVRRIITNMTDQFARPIAFKSFLLIWHMASFQQALPRTCFVWVRRDPLETAMSILRFREGFAGSRDTWVSMRPLAYEELVDLPRAEQVAAQVADIEATISANTKAAAPDTVLEVEYARLCSEPATVLSECRQLLGHNGYTPNLIGRPPESFDMPPLDLDDPDLEAVRLAIDTLYGRPE